MHRRLLISTIAVAVSAIIVLGVPLAIVAAHLLRNDEVERLDRQADAIGLALDDRVEQGLPITPSLLAPFTRRGQRIEFLDASGRLVTAGPIINGGVLTSTVPAGDGAHITVIAKSGAADGRIREAWALIAGLGVIGVAVAAALATAQARRLAAPLRDIADSASRLGAGDFSARTPRTGISDVDAIASALDDSAKSIASMVAAEREFSVDASHQLRTPLTALRIRLEELVGDEADPERHEELERCIALVDRLETTITELLRLKREGRIGRAELIEIDEVLVAHRKLWVPRFRASGRTVIARAASGATVFAAPGGLGQAIDVLVENALVHGVGRVTISSAVDAAGRVLITVADEGHGIPSAERERIFDRHVSSAKSTGIGLALARLLVESEGGRLVVQPEGPTTFTIRLPAGRVASAAAPAGFAPVSTAEVDVAPGRLGAAVPDLPEADVGSDRHHDGESRQQHLDRPA